MAAPSIRATGVVNTGTGPTLTPVIPPTTVDGDLMLLIGGMKYDGATSGAMAVPAGWNAIAGLPYTHGASSEPKAVAAWRIKQSGDSNPVLTSVNNMASIAVIISVQGDYDPAAPINANSYTESIVSGTTVTSNDLTPLRDNGLVFFAAFSGNSGLTSGVTHSGWSGTNPTFTEIVDSSLVGGSGGGNFSLGIAWGNNVGTSALGTRTVGLSGARNWIATMFSVPVIGGNVMRMVI